MKNIIIFGICRTGKSTFSKMIQKEFKNYQIIEVDTIISALQKTIPDLPIGFIINGDSILPEDLLKYFDLKNVIVYYFVTEKLSPEQILQNCRKFDSEKEWTTRRTDTELLDHFRFYKNIEKEIIMECQKYNIKYVDTSENREMKLNQLLDNVKMQLTSGN